MVIISILAGLVTFFAMQYYAKEDGKAPPISTKKGKEARIVVGISSVILLSSLIANATIADTRLAGPSLSAIFAGGLVGVVGYAIRNRKK